MIITKHGKPVMAALSFDQFESLLETLAILSDREFAHQLRESIDQGERGETINWKEVKAMKHNVSRLSVWCKELN
ncbi:MAG: type II toxin-antitoxin system Phd/YefM family antitoxin [Nostoc sp.]